MAAEMTNPNGQSEDMHEGQMFDQTTKGLPFGPAVAPSHIESRGWNVVRGDLPFPLLVLKESALAANLRAMAEWCRENNLLFAPHGKTTMCPQIFARQLAHGAWGITIATVSQAMICAHHGVERIFIANQVVGSSNLRALASLLNEQPRLDVYCLVDSVDGTAQLARGMREHGAQRAIKVLLECGRRGWRTGVRSREQARAVYEEIARHQSELNLCGIEAFEGLASAPGGADEEAQQVAEFFEVLWDISRSLWNERPADTLPYLSVGGSAYLDQVYELARRAAGRFQVVLRSGCYVTHDHGAYQEKHAAASSRAAGRFSLPAFSPALELWSYVQSVPQSDLAFLTFGKRDCAYDIGLPIPLSVLGAGEQLSSARPLSGARITNLNDQHAYLSFDDAVRLRVGDVVCCGISHPCTAFDKWRVIPVVDDAYNVIDLYRTYF